MTIKDATGVVVAVFCLCMVFFQGERIDQSNIDRAINAHAHETQMTDSQMYEILLKGVIHSKMTCAVQTDVDGVIVFRNKRFGDVFGLGVGDKIEQCMTGETKRRHLKGYREAIHSHQTDDSKPYREVHGGCIDRFGNEVEVDVSSWTTQNGGMAFVHVKDDAEGKYETSGEGG